MKKQKKSINRIVAKPPKQLKVTTVQNSIPIYAVHEKVDIIETYPTSYTKMYMMSDVNYQTSIEEDQELMWTKYKAFINSIGNNAECAITIYNRNIDMEKFSDETLYKEVGDKLDTLRREMNEINLARIAEGKNGIKKDKYITMAIHTDSLKKASAVFNRIDREIVSSMAAIGCTAAKVPINERLEVLHNIYNNGYDGGFLSKTKVITESGIQKEVTSFDFENLRSMGLTVNDVLSSSSLIFYEDYIEIGDKYARVLQITDLPSSLSDVFLTDLTNVEFNMLTTLNIKPISVLKANNMINRNLSLIRTNIAKEQKAAIKGNYSTDMISPDLVSRQNEAQKLHDDVRENDEHLFQTSISICIFADSKDQLDEYTDTITTECRKASVTATTIALLQEEGFNATLPLCYNLLPESRTLTSSATAAFIPFNVLDICDSNGIIYSLNAISKNLLKYNRLAKQNFNGFILGTPGCFTGNTKIRLTDGKCISFEKLVKRKGSFEVNSYDIERRKLVKTLGRNARVTKYVKDLAKVTIETGEIIECTLDHLFLTKDNVYVEAQKLLVGNMLMPTHSVINIELVKLEKEVPVYDIEVEDYENYQLECGIYVHNSGKSFAAKVEMLSVLLSTNADVIVIDPESEYGAMANLLGGEIIKIAPGSKAHINPMDITSDYDEATGDPVLAKADFILKLCETIIKTPYGLNSIQETIIDRCVTELYKNYLSIDEKYRNTEQTPTLCDFQKLLSKQQEPEAREISLALGLYTTGSLNTFAHHTNVNVKNRFIVYDIKDVGEKMKPMSMLIVLDSIWNRICHNRRLGKNTWFYVDEIYLLFQNEISATFLNMLFKRARKYGGVPTGITQNVEDLLESETARKMLSNCNFVQMLNQAPADRAHLKDLLNLSTAQLDFITSAQSGQGLIYTGSNTIPYYSTFPKNNGIYRCLTSDMKEIEAYKEEERRAKIKQKKFERTS